MRHVRRTIRAIKRATLAHARSPSATKSPGDRFFAAATAHFAASSAHAAAGSALMELRDDRGIDAT